MYEILAVLAVFGLLYGIFAGGIEKSPITGPMVFVAFGLIIGPLGLGIVSGANYSQLLRSLAELTLALLLFTDAAGMNLRVLRRAQRLPLRLLSIGLPLTILAGIGVGRIMFPDWPILEVALLATILAPTDAALGKTVVSNKAVPPVIREGLTAESGLNDGICVPVLFLFKAILAGGVVGQSSLSIGLSLFAEEIGIGVVVALIACGSSVWLIQLSFRNGWTSPNWNSVLVVGLALSCFAVAQALGGSGFIASFVGGLLFNFIYKGHHDELLEGAEGIGSVLAYLTWTLFGAMVVSGLFGNLNVTFVVYALLSLTVVRMVPVFISLHGLSENTEAKLFVGWFGPRGLASIVFTVIIITDENLLHATEITWIVACTVTLSIILHGVTAIPWSRRFGGPSRA